MTKSGLTWLAPSQGQSRRDFLASVHDLVRSFPEAFVATAIPFGPSGNLTMLHVVAGTVDGELVRFHDSIIREFEVLAAETVAQLSTEELTAAQGPLDSREIGGLSCATGEELAVVASTAKVRSLQDRIATLLMKTSGDKE
jgi:hypothetical protein